MELSTRDFKRQWPSAIERAAVDLLRFWPSLVNLFFPSPQEAVRRFMERHDVSALSLTVAKGGAIVFEQAFGVADPATGAAVTPAHRFRIASCSKPITAAAICLLVERGQLRFTDRVFGDHGILGNTYGTKPYTNWLVQIDVQQLLEHTAGGWGNEVNDPMFQNHAWTHAELITHTLDADLLIKPSGLEFHYSNFGYCLLGRIIERCSGMPYEPFVLQHILRPAGAAGMRIGSDTLAERAPDEVVYRCTNADPYAQPLRRMDAHGGWTATASDCVRFLLAIDARPPGILSPASVASMRTPNSVSPSMRYGKGVGTDGSAAWHTGLLSGTRAIMRSEADGNAWFVVCTGGPGAGDKARKSSTGGDAVMEELDELMGYVVPRV